MDPLISPGQTPASITIDAQNNGQISLNSSNNAISTLNSTPETAITLASQGPQLPTETIEMSERINPDGSKTVIKRTTRLVTSLEPVYGVGNSHLGANVVASSPSDMVRVSDLQARWDQFSERVVNAKTGKPAAEFLDKLPPRPFKLWVPEADSIAADATSDPDYVLKPGEQNINLDPIYNIMMWRKFERARTGTRRPPSWTNWIWALLILCLFIVWVGFLGDTFRNSETWVNVLIALIIIPLALFLSVTITVFIKSALYLLVAGLIVLACVYAAYPPISNGNTTTPSPQYSQALYIIAIIEIVLVGIAILLHLGYYVLYPWLVKKGFINLQSHYHAIPGKKGVWKYRAWEPQQWKFTTNTISYRGEVDAEMRPHGYGSWRDDAYSGEVYNGYFEHGNPVGPFVSREFGTGNAFSCVLIGHARNGKGGWSGRPWFPSREFPEGGLRWGYARVECSVAGKFFSKFPEPVQVMEGEWDKERPYALDQVIDGLAVGEDPRSVDVTDEALIFIHGYNASIESTCITFGQLLAMADFPRYIKPFIFSWPSANSITYLPARTMITSDECIGDFVDMLQKLGEKGFAKIHIIGHSMGSRLATAISSRMSEIFQPLSNSPLYTGTVPTGKTGQPLARLVSLTLLNAEAPLYEFLETDFEILRNYCDLISVYNDEADGPLQLAYNTSKIFPPKNDPYGKGYKPLGRYAKECYKEDASVMVMGRSGKVRPRRSYPDIDIISTTSLDANIQGMRHTFFSSNRMLTDDLTDIIVFRKRAAQRDTRLIRLDGVQYSFLSPPSFFKF